jgi:hypothetical protein
MITHTDFLDALAGDFVPGARAMFERRFVNRGPHASIIGGMAKFLSGGPPDQVNRHFKPGFRWREKGETELSAILRRLPLKEGAAEKLALDWHFQTSYIGDVGRLAERAITLLDQPDHQRHLLKPENRVRPFEREVREALEPYKPYLRIGATEDLIGHLLLLHGSGPSVPQTVAQAMASPLAARYTTDGGPVAGVAISPPARSLDQNRPVRQNYF